MLSSDFVEEYFRAENDLNENPQRFEIDRNNGVVYTTPFFVTETIKNDKLSFTFSNGIPSNVNLVIDNVTIVVTNPNVGNLLPLKFSFGVKPQIEFGDMDVRTITNYEITTDPVVNLDTISNYKWEKSKFLAFNTEIDPVPNVFVDNIVIGGVFAFFRTDTELIYKYNLVTNESEDITQADPSFEIFANDSGAILWTVNDEIYNINTAIGVAPVLIKNYPPAQAVIDLVLTKNVLYIVYREGATSYMEIFTITSDEVFLFENIELPVELDTLENFEVYKKNRFFAKLAGGPPDDVLDFTVDDDGGVTINQTLSSAVTTPIIKIYVGGSNEDFPNYSIFKQVTVVNPDPNPALEDFYNINWYYHVYDPVKKRYNEAIVTVFESVCFNTGSRAVPVLVEPVIKRFFNTAYFTETSFDSPNTNLCNLDTNESIHHNFSEKSPPYTGYNVGIGESYLVSGGIPSQIAIREPTNQNKIGFDLYNQVRTITDVYRLSYNYQERIFPYQITSDRFIFNVSLPDGKFIKDLELFKYIIDYRIRYTKESLAVNPVRPIAEVASQRSLRSPKNKHTLTGKDRQDRSDVDKVLGYVDKDFSVNDFLHIYTGA